MSQFSSDDLNRIVRELIINTREECIKAEIAKLEYDLNLSNPVLEFISSDYFPYFLDSCKRYLEEHHEKDHLFSEFKKLAQFIYNNSTIGIHPGTPIENEKFIARFMIGYHLQKQQIVNKYFLEEAQIIRKFTFVKTIEDLSKTINELVEWVMSKRTLIGDDQDVINFDVVLELKDVLSTANTTD